MQGILDSCLEKMELEPRKDGVGASQTGKGFHRQEDFGERAFLAKKTM